jgi:hypothetical protein
MREEMRSRKDTRENRASWYRRRLGRALIPCHVFLGQCNGIFSHNCLPRRCVSCDKDRVMLFQVQDGLFLKHIWLKCPLWEREINGG